MVYGGTLTAESKPSDHSTATYKIQPQAELEDLCEHFAEHQREQCA